uniref:Transmembrane protein n=1 Tax=Glossina palpalis gambiensis TaxID=67801 RepID=A0A1B0AUX9_9MUSC
MSTTTPTATITTITYIVQQRILHHYPIIIVVSAIAAAAAAAAVAVAVAVAVAFGIIIKWLLASQLCNIQ